MEKRLLSYDGITDLATWHSYDEATDETIISYTSNSAPVIERNKLLANDPDFSHDGIKDGMWLYASIPVEVQLKWLIEDGIDIRNPEHGARMSEKLCDPMYRYLKTTTRNHKFK